MEKEKFLSSFEFEEKEYYYYDINKLSKDGFDIKRLPYSIKILLENILRNLDEEIITEKDVKNVAGWKKKQDSPVEIPYKPIRVLMQDFTGVPAVVDLAAMRDAMVSLGKNPEKINPLVPVDLVVDHSVQIDYYGTSDSINKNVFLEYKRNEERYKFLKWAQKAFHNFRVVPPNSGICHQVNLEYLAKVVVVEERKQGKLVYPDTCIGTDSHTPMVNGIGVMGWGVGGIEAEAVMLGQPYYMPIPEVIGVKLVGELKEGVTATDLILTITEKLRRYGVVDKFVEYFGPGIKTLSITDRATISNMTPEFGATLGIFPIDKKTIDYLKLTNREKYADILEIYAKKIGLYYTGQEKVDYTDVLEIDLGSIEPSIAGPSRPQDRISLKDVKTRVSASKKDTIVTITLNDTPVNIRDGSVVIAAITSCTNTSNPYVMIGAGLLARNAVKKGLKVKPYVKTSLAPGSKVVEAYLKKANLLPYLEALGFHVTAYGCTTCIGNSGPLLTEIEKVIVENNLNVASVLSGNRNFEARIHQLVKSNYLSSPILVVAYALAGNIDIDFTSEPIGFTPYGEKVMLKDIWPKSEEIEEILEHVFTKADFKREYAKIFDGDEFWKRLNVRNDKIYNWQERSTYIKKPPYFDDFDSTLSESYDILGARVLLMLGDSITTDHISPAGEIDPDYPAGKYLISKGVGEYDFNSYGSRRGNHEVMIRGTFGNIRLKNKMVDKEGSWTIKYPERRLGFVYDVAMEYKKDNTPLIVLAGKEYGTGSSRDWAAKGTRLLGIKAVIAESFERIHKSNLVGMGVLPLQFKDGESWQSLGLKGDEVFNLKGIQQIYPRKTISVEAVRQDGGKTVFEVVARLDTQIEVEYYLNGGILPYVLRRFL
ncbi:MAG: aconitate hydratase AcnA [Calditerrivibrio sp.]|nr:aconitate hydratase AcnA [Calditerrivibrio sp.]